MQFGLARGLMTEAHGQQVLSYPRPHQLKLIFCYNSPICLNVYIIKCTFARDLKTTLKMKLKSLMNRFVAISFAALMALGCGLEKPVTPDEPEENDPTQTEGTSIADVLKAEAGGTFELENVLVVGANTNGVLLQQMGSYIYAFKGSEHNLQVGDLLKVSGTTTSRNGLIQFGSGCTLEKIGTAAFTFPEPETMSVETIESYMSNPSIKYVTYVELSFFQAIIQTLK